MPSMASSVTRKRWPPMSKPSALTPTTPTPTSSKAMLSLTSSVTRKRWPPMSKPSALTPTTPTPTTSKAMLSTNSSAIRKQNRLLKKHANLSRETVATTISPNDETTTSRIDHLAYAPHPDASKDAHENSIHRYSNGAMSQPLLHLFRMYVRL